MHLGGRRCAPTPLKHERFRLGAQFFSGAVNFFPGPTQVIPGCYSVFASMFGCWESCGIWGLQGVMAKLGASQRPRQRQPRQRQDFRVFRACVIARWGLGPLNLPAAAAPPIRRRGPLNLPAAAASPIRRSKQSQVKFAHIGTAGCARWRCIWGAACSTCKSTRVWCQSSDLHVSNWNSGSFARTAGQAADATCWNRKQVARANCKAGVECCGNHGGGQLGAARSSPWLWVLGWRLSLLVPRRVAGRRVHI